MDAQLKEEAIVSFVLLCTDSPTPSKKMPERCREVAVESNSIGAAISAACRLIDDGVVVWKIKGDGFVMERTDIETERLRRQGAAV
jgi:hypothetical protein